MAMFSENPDFIKNTVLAPTTGPGRRRAFHIAGVNEVLTDELNRRGPTLNHKPDRSNVDTPQNVISVTTINLPPPIHPQGDLARAEELYAPISRKADANIPVRGDWA